MKLGANTALNSGTVELGAVTGSGKNLTLNNTGVATLNGTESGIGVLSASGSGTLVVNNNPSAASVSDTEGTTLNGTGVTTTGDQSYTGTVTLGANTALNSGTLELGAVTVTGGAKNLTLNNTGVATLSGAVNGVGILTASAGAKASLVVDNDISAASFVDIQNTTFNGHGSSETVATIGGDQTYGDQTHHESAIFNVPTTLTADTVIQYSTFSGRFVPKINGRLETLLGVYYDSDDDLVAQSGNGIVLLEDVIKGIFGTMAEQVQTPSTVGGEVSPEKPYVPPGAHLKRSGEVPMLSK